MKNSIDLIKSKEVADILKKADMSNIQLLITAKDKGSPQVAGTVVHGSNDFMLTTMRIAFDKCKTEGGMTTDQIIVELLNMGNAEKSVEEVVQGEVPVEQGTKL